MSRSPAAVLSPCNSVCRIDERSGWCLGCFRTLDEIVAWSALDEAQKRGVRDALPSRRRLTRLQAKEREVGP